MSKQKIKKKLNKTNLSELIFTDLENLKLGESLKVSDLVSKHWNVSDCWTTRSFDVYFCKAKSVLKEKGILFIRAKGMITKIKK